MSKVLLTIEQVRFIWYLGFSSGRVQNAAHPNTGITWDEETPLFEADLIRVASANKQLSKKLKAANTASTRLETGAPNVDSESNPAVSSG